VFKKAIIAAGIGLALSSLLSACGGGGDSGPTFTIAFDSPSYSREAFHGQQLTGTSDPGVAGTVTGSTDGQVYVMVLDSGTAFGAQQVDVDTWTGTRFHATLQPNTALAAGTYNGKLQVLICRDSACTSRYNVQGGTLPYTVVIDPRIQVEAYVNGVDLGDLGAGPLHAGTVPANSTLELKSTSPINSVNFSSGPGELYVAVDPSSTKNDYKATVTVPNGTYYFDLALWTVSGAQASNILDLTVAH